MKNLKMIIACLLIMSFFITNISFTFAENKYLVNPKDAELAAKLFLERKTSVNEELSNAKLSTPEKYYDVNNELIAYVYTINIQDNAVGYITISADYNMSPVLEYSTSTPPHNKVDKAFISVLKDKGDKYKVKKSQLMYLGPLLYVAKITVSDDVTTNEVFYNLKSDQLLEESFISVTKSIKDSSQHKSFKYKWDKIKNTDTINNTLQNLALSISEYKINGVPIYNQFLSSYGNTGCGPAVGAMILQYWNSNGYSSIPGSSTYGSAASFMDHMGVHMGTDVWASGTTMTQLSNGIISHINSHTSYRNFTATQDGPDVSYYEYKAAINRNEPVAIYIDYTDSSLEYGFHWVTGVGYYQDTVYEDNMIYIHNCFGSSPSNGTDYIDFDQYMLNKDLNFVYIAD